MRPVQTACFCASCGKGEMIATGSVIHREVASYYLHCCNNCGFYSEYLRSYPYIEWVRRGEIKLDKLHEVIDWRTVECQGMGEKDD